MNRIYTLIWTDENGIHEHDYDDLDIVLDEIRQCTEIDIRNGELCDYTIKVKEEL